MFGAKRSKAMTVLPQATKTVPNKSLFSFSCRKLINCMSDLDFNISSSVAATSTSNEELNYSTVNECNELACCCVSERSKKNERVFYHFSDISPLPTVKLTHGKRKAKQELPHNWFLV